MYTHALLCGIHMRCTFFFGPWTQLGRAHKFEVEENPLQQLLSESRSPIRVGFQIKYRIKVTARNFASLQLVLIKCNEVYKERNK